MMQFEFQAHGSCGKSVLSPAVLLALALLTAGCDRDEQQATKQPTAAQGGSPASAQPAAPPASVAQPPAAAPAATAPPPAGKPLSDLESLVAPIALYPDPLLAELLVASTYPLEVVQAARWLDTKPDLSTLSGKDWDASVMRLVSLPQVVKMMSDHLDWTTQLGDTFLAKPAELMDAIQVLRKRATDSGFLKDTPEQTVTAKKVSSAADAAPSMDETGAESAVKATPAVLKQEVITIEPAKADTIYVPQYNPETAYQAPMAAPPAATTASYAYPAAAPAPAYYPAYYPPPATTTSTTSTTDSLLTFGAGALAGGLLTWGLMEWADDDDDYYHGGYYPVNHAYGGAVCNNGNCWNGGGGYSGDRGNVNYNKNVNVSGNEINIDRGGVFSQNDLRPSQRPAAWQPNARHRRGQAYPEAAKQRLGRTEQPALAGQRLGAAQTLPATQRGFAGVGERPGTIQAERRPSSAEIQQRLAQKPGAGERQGDKLAQSRPSTRDIQGQLGQGARDNALAGVGESGQNARMESRRGAQSRGQKVPASREVRAREPAGGERMQRSQVEQPRQRQAQERAGFQNRQRDQAQQMDRQRRSESTRPNAFEGERNARATQDSSRRGAASRGASAGGGGRSGGAAGGGGRSGGAAAGGGRGGGGRAGGGGGGGGRAGGGGGGGGRRR